MDKMKLQNDEFDAADGFAKQLVRLFKTPVVDDDYPEVLHGYESALRSLIDALKANGRIPDVAAPQPVEPTGDDWYTDPDTGTHTLDLDDNPNRQLSIMLKSDGTAVFAAYLNNEKIVGAVTEDFRNVVLRWAAPQPVEAEGLPLSVQGVLDRWKGVVEGGGVMGYSPSEIEIIRLMADEMARAIPPPKQPVEADGNPPVELRICEVAHLALKPNTHYLFTIDPNCEACRAAAAYAIGKSNQQPEQPAIDHQTIVGLLRAHRLMRWQDDAGNQLPLVDHLTPPGSDSIQPGLDEIEQLADEIMCAIIDGAKGERT